MSNPNEKRCHRCVEKGVSECTITLNADSYARPRTPVPPGQLRPTSVLSLPTISTPLPSLSETESYGSLPQHPPDHQHCPGLHLPQELRSPHQGSSNSDGGSMVVHGSPPGSEDHSRRSGSAAFWSKLFEEDTSMKPKKERETSPGVKVDVQPKEGRKSFTLF